ncbi:MAG: hypothetical protein OXG74_11660 [Acidobacteria bacterium]|nr:hypothetical protein [Acidobacteriota bacterium]
MRAPAIACLTVLAMPLAAQEEGPAALLGLAQAMVARYEPIARITARAVESACDEPSQRCVEHLSVRLWSLRGSRTAMEVTLATLEDRWPDVETPLKDEWPKEVKALAESIADGLDIARKHQIVDAVNERVTRLFQDDMTFHVFEATWVRDGDRAAPE